MLFAIEGLIVGMGNLSMFLSGGGGDCSQVKLSMPRLRSFIGYFATMYKGTCDWLLIVYSC